MNPGKSLSSKDLTGTEVLSAAAEIEEENEVKGNAQKLKTKVCKEIVEKGQVKCSTVSGWTGNLFHHGTGETIRMEIIEGCKTLPSIIQIRKSDAKIEMFNLP